MNSTVKYILGVLAFFAVCAFCWYFFSVILYILIAAVLSFLGRPIANFLRKIKFKNFSPSNTICAAASLTVIWVIAIIFFYTIIPLVSQEFNSLSNINIDQVTTSLADPISKCDIFLQKYGIIESSSSLTSNIKESISSFVQSVSIRSTFGSLADTISGIFIALFSVSFITFFFLKDSKQFSGMILAIVPSKYEEQTLKALDSIEKLLVRYFVGICFEVICIMILNSIGLTIIGINFNNAVVIALITGILNVIPYIGPLIGIVFGITVGIIINFDLPFATEVLPLLLSMTIVLVITQLIDNFLLQPFIYGNSVYAHPLEIFLIILLAGNFAGIAGMILAIPSYTVLRVILREFFNNYKLVKSITKSLENKK